MAKRISHREKARIYRPKSAEPSSNIKDWQNEVLGRDFSSVYKTYLITDNYTNSYGNVANRLDSNVVLAKEEVDANEK